MRQNEQKNLQLDKRAITLIVFFVVFAITLIVCGTLFIVRDVQVSYATDYEKNFITASEIVDASQIKFGKSIFVVSESNSVSAIEGKYPAVKVINIERKFPSKIIIHITLRTPIYAVKIKDKDLYAELDREMFVVKKVTSAELDDNLTKVNYELQDEKVVVGKVVAENVSRENIIAQNIAIAFEDEKIANKAFCDFVKHVSISIDDNAYSVEVTINTGLKILFSTSEFDKAGIDNKISLAYKWYLAEIDKNGSGSDKLTSGCYIEYKAVGANPVGEFFWYRK